MANTCVCRYCKKEIDKDNAYSISKGMYYCSEQHYLSSLEKKKQKGNHSYKSAKGTDRRDYSDYIQALYIEYGWDKNNINWQIIFSQTNTLLKNNPKWSYETIKYILWYEKEILGLQLITKESNWSPLSLVDYHGKEAEEFYNKLVKIEEEVNNFNFDDEEIVVKANKNPSWKKIDFGG